MAGAAFWGWAGVVIRQRTPRARARPRHGLDSLLRADLSPAWTQLPAPSTWTPTAVGALIALGLLCSGVATFPFSTLVRDIGPTRTLTSA